MIKIEILLDTMRLIIGIAILGYASYTDIKTRRASNLNWLIMGSAGATLLVIQYFTVGFNGQEMYLLFIPIILIFIPIMIGLVYLFTRCVINSKSSNKIVISQICDLHV